VRNIGNAASSATTVNFYASVDTTISTTDALLGSRPLAALASGTPTTCSLAAGATASLAAGQSYYVGWIVDPNGTVTESNESNNRAVAGGVLVATSATTSLPNGVPVSFTVAANDTLSYQISLPANVTSLAVTIAGVGDTDLYVKRQPISWPSDQGYHNETEFKAPYLWGPNESVLFNSPASGTWNVLLHGFFPSSSGTVRASWVSGSSTAWVRETPHPYANSSTYSFTYSAPGATQVGVHFSQLTTEVDYDFLRVRNAQGTILYSESGSLISNGVATPGIGPVFGRSDGWCIIQGSSITIELQTDSSVTAYGFRTDLAYAAY